jgi:single-strand DNA-binding protein
MDMLKVIASGRLGQDPRIRQLDDGTPVLNLSMASGRRKKGQDLTYWWDVTQFGERGLKIHDMLKKGSHILVEGDYSERSYVDKQGNQRTQREIVASNIYLLDRKADESTRHESGAASSYGGFSGQRSRPFPLRAQYGAQAPQGGRQSSPSQDEPPPFDGPAFGEEDEIPF